MLRLCWEIGLDIIDLKKCPPELVVWSLRAMRPRPQKILIFFSNHRMSLRPDFSTWAKLFHFSVFRDCYCCVSTKLTWLIKMKPKIYRKLFFLFGQIISYVIFFSCPEQLNRWPCHSLTDSCLLLPYKE